MSSSPEPTLGRPLLDLLALLGQQHRLHPEERQRRAARLRRPRACIDKITKCCVLRSTSRVAQAVRVQRTGAGCAACLDHPPARGEIIALPVSVCHQVSASDWSARVNGNLGCNLGCMDTFTARVLSWKQIVRQHKAGAKCIAYLLLDTGPRRPPGQTTSRLRRLQNIGSGSDNGPSSNAQTPLSWYTWHVT